MIKLSNYQLLNKAQQKSINGGEAVLPPLGWSIFIDPAKLFVPSTTTSPSTSSGTVTAEKPKAQETQTATAA